MNSSVFSIAGTRVPRSSTLVKPLIAREFFRAVLDSTDDHVMVFDREGHVVYANRGWAAVGGSASDGLGCLEMGASYLAAREVGPVGVLLADERLRGVRKVLCGEQLRFEHEYSIGWGPQRRWLLMRVEPMPPEYGGVIIRHTDVTARASDAKMLQDQNDSFHLLADFAPVMMWTSGRDRRFSVSNKRWLEYTGHTLRHDVGQGWAEQVHPDDLAKVIREYSTAFDARREFLMEYRLNRADGSYGWILDHGVPVRAANSDLTGYIGVCIDISTSKETQKELLESEARFRLVAGCAPVVVWMTDAECRCLYISEYWQRLTGRNPKEDLGFGWIGAIHPEDRNRAARDLIESGKNLRPCKGEYRVLRADGTYGWLSDFGVPQIRADGSYAGYVGTCIDITDRKNWDAARLGIQDRLFMAQEDERTRIARELHDDIGQRLALCNVRLSEILSHPTALPKEIRVRMAEFQEHADKLASDIQRIAHNLHPSTLAHLGLVPALRRLAKDFSVHMGIAVSFYEHKVPTAVPEQTSIGLFRIAQQCLSNVAKHSHSRLARLSVRGYRSGIQLTVFDSGVGFDPVAVSQTSRGIGLTSIQERVRMLRGESTIQSNGKSGTKVIIWLPVRTEATRQISLM